MLKVAAQRLSVSSQHRPFVSAATQEHNRLPSILHICLHTGRGTSRFMGRDGLISLIRSTRQGHPPVIFIRVLTDCKSD